MVNEPSHQADAFDIRSIRQLVKLMNDNDLSEIDLQSGTQRVRLRKQQPEQNRPASTPVLAAPATPPPALVAIPPTAPKPTAPDEPVGYLEIKSPMLGTFYRSPSPDANPFVQVGSHVDNDSVVCIIEAMKVFNEITADCRGKIIAVLVENAQAVEYGQVLFRVDPTG